jgi:hypothetical protein
LRRLALIRGKIKLPERRFQRYLFCAKYLVSLLKKVSQMLAVDLPHLHKVLRPDIVLHRETRPLVEAHLRIEEPEEVLGVELCGI